ncbi:MAG: bifunctional DNA primase/polymerase [Planctomycetaceae bacterium]|jgi:hypothetical protein|nr:bifunctional DNA primase/polymerase [Planctomycetaceae bacterium]
MSELILQAALQNHARGWCQIPMQRTGKQPAVRWKQWQTRRPREATLCNWFRGESGYGLAVVFGEISGNLGSRDFDDAALYRAWADNYPDLAKTLPTAKTFRGAHVYFATDPRAVAAYRRSIGKPDGNGAIHLGDGELRVGVGCYSLVPPSPHPKGGAYRWILPPGETLPLVTDFVAAGLVPPCHREEREHRGRQRITEAMRGTDGVALSDCIQSLLQQKGFLASKETGAVAERTTGPSDIPADVLRAIDATLPKGPGQRNRHVFEFARALKALPGYRDADVKSLDREIRAWHERAKPFIETQPFEETLIDFRKGCGQGPFSTGTGADDHDCRAGLFRSRSGSRHEVRIGTGPPSGGTLSRTPASGRGRAVLPVLPYGGSPARERPQIGEPLAVPTGRRRNSPDRRKGVEPDTKGNPLPLSAAALKFNLRMSD